MGAKIGLRGPQDDNGFVRGAIGDGWYVGGRSKPRPYGETPWPEAVRRIVVSVSSRC
jgi:hypothetical protein